LKEAQRSRSQHRRIVSGSSSISRSPSPATHSSVDTEHQKLTELDRRTKASPFNASLFSQRRNRSLPNLSELINAKDIHNNSSNKKEQSERKMQSARRRLAHSRSSIINRSVTPPPILSRRKKAVLEKNRKERNQETPAKKNTALPEAVSDSDSDDARSSTSSLASRGMKTNQGSAFLSPKSAERDVIADGALSDSEVDRHRNVPQPHGSDVTEWKWGELPKTRDDQQAQREKKPLTKQIEEVRKEESSWSGWFRWSKPKPSDDQGIYLDDLVENSLSDPSKIEKYLGKSSSACPSPPYDSGNASVTSGGHNSPQSASDGEDTTQKEPSGARDDTTPTEDKTKSIGTEEMKVSDLTEPSEASTDIASIPPQPSSQLPNGKSDERERQPSGRSKSPSSDIFKMSDEETEAAGTSSSQGGGAAEPPKTYIRSLRLSSEKLKQLPLRRGTNEARFSITTKFQVVLPPKRLLGGLLEVFPNFQFLKNLGFLDDLPLFSSPPSNIWTEKRMSVARA
uniref:Adenylate cyclase n=1 Tax=Toxocara canis TaxID=6265 RepID=A0A183VDM4_TOXCA